MHLTSKGTDSKSLIVPSDFAEKFSSSSEFLWKYLDSIFNHSLTPAYLTSLQ